MRPGLHTGALPGWLARRRYRPRLKRQIVAKLRAARATPPGTSAETRGDASIPTSLWTILASLGGNVVPLRRAAPSLAEQD